MTQYSALQGLYSITTRIGGEGLVPPDWMLDQRITIEEALKSITIDAAYGTFQEDQKGSIHEGKLADFVVLSDNPLEMLPEDLLDLSVDMTIIGGKVVYCAEGLETMCEGVYEVDTSITSDSTTSVSSETTLTDSDPTSSTNASVPIHLSYLLIFVILKFKRKKIIGINRRKSTTPNSEY